LPVASIQADEESDKRETRVDIDCTKRFSTEAERNAANLPMGLFPHFKAGCKSRTQNES